MLATKLQTARCKQLKRSAWPSATAATSGGTARCSIRELLQGNMGSVPCYAVVLERIHDTHLTTHRKMRLQSKAFRALHLYGPCFLSNPWCRDCPARAKALPRSLLEDDPPGGKACSVQTPAACSCRGAGSNERHSPSCPKWQAKQNLAQSSQLQLLTQAKNTEPKVGLQGAA